MTEPDDKIDIEAVYLGRRPGQKSEAVYGFITPVLLSAKLVGFEGRSFIRGAPFEVTREIDNAASWFSFKTKPCQAIGGVYTFKGLLYDEDDGRIKSMTGSTLKYTRYLDDEQQRELVSAWKNLDSELSRAKALASLEKNAETDPAMKNALDVLRKRYQKTMPATRMAFKVWLIAELEKR